MEKYGIKGKLIIPIDIKPIINENKNTTSIGSNFSIFSYKYNIKIINDNITKITPNIKLINIIA